MQSHYREKNKAFDAYYMHRVAHRDGERENVRIACTISQGSRLIAV
jgi:hypothetical protein